MNKGQQKRFAKALVALLARGDAGDLAGLANEIAAEGDLWKSNDPTLEAITDALAKAWLDRSKKEARKSRPCDNCGKPNENESSCNFCPPCQEAFHASAAKRSAEAAARYAYDLAKLRRVPGCSL